MDCPRDRTPLAPLALDHATCWGCPACGGRGLTVALLRRVMPRDQLRTLWAHARTGRRGSAPCPSCARPMRTLSAGDAEGTLQIELDACALCEIVWFDPKELEDIAPGVSRPAPVLGARPAAGAGRPGEGRPWAGADFLRTLTKSGTQPG